MLSEDIQCVLVMQPLARKVSLELMLELDRLGLLCFTQGMAEFLAMESIRYVPIDTRLHI